MTQMSFETHSEALPLGTWRRPRTRPSPCEPGSKTYIYIYVGRAYELKLKRCGSRVNTAPGAILKGQQYIVQAIPPAIKRVNRRQFCAYKHPKCWEGEPPKVFVFVFCRFWCKDPEASAALERLKHLEATVFPSWGVRSNVPGRPARQVAMRQFLALQLPLTHTLEAKELQGKA